MLKENWSLSGGVTNTGENDDSVFAKKVGNSVHVAYMAYSGIKVVELGNIEDVIDDVANSDFTNIVMNCVGDDWEAVIPCVVDGARVCVIIDSNSSIKTIGMDAGDVIKVVPIVAGSMEYDVDDYEELAEEDEELLQCFHLL